MSILEMFAVFFLLIICAIACALFWVFLLALHRAASDKVTVKNVQPDEGEWE